MDNIQLKKKRPGLNIISRTLITEDFKCWLRYLVIYWITDCLSPKHPKLVTSSCFKQKSSKPLHIRSLHQSRMYLGLKKKKKSMSTSVILHKWISQYWQRINYMRHYPSKMPYICWFQHLFSTLHLYGVKMKKVASVKMSNIQQYLENKEIIYCETNVLYKRDISYKIVIVTFHISCD